MEAFMNQFIQDMQKYAHDKALDFCKVIKKLGLENNELEGWIQIYKEQVIEVHSLLMQDVNDCQDKLLDNIEKLLKDSELLCKELRINMPAYGNQQLSLYKEQKFLQDRIKELQGTVELKKKEFYAIQKREVELAECLGVPATIDPRTPLPTQEEMNNYQRIVEQLESEKFNRDEEFLTLKCQIIDLAKELNYVPCLDFEKTVLSIDDSLFMVTTKNMNRLREFHGCLSSQLQDTKSDIEELTEKIKCLWDMLQEDLHKQESFKNNLPEITIDKLVCLKNEVKRCEDLKKANIEKFVIKLRETLVNLWEQCRFSKEQREDFFYFNVTMYTEDLLSHHDIEINKLKQHYFENKELYKLLEKMEDLWKRMLEFEEKVNSKDRYKNRGGELLREEKERSAIYKQLPQIEMRIKELSDKYEVDHGKPFLVWGESVKQLIAKNHEDREQEKKQKLSARKQYKEMTLTPAKSYMSLAGSTQNLAKTPLSIAKSSKRKIPTALVRSNKRTKLFPDDANAGTSEIPKLQLNSKTVVLRNSFDFKKKVARVRRISQRLATKKENLNTSSSSAYDDFKVRQQAYDTNFSPIPEHPH